MVNLLEMKVMKKIYLLSLALCALVLSCSKESGEPQAQKLVPMKFEAQYEQDAITRATLDGVNVKWNAGDRIAVFDNISPTTAHIFTADGGGETTTSFSGEVNEGATLFMAVYPYDAVVAESTTLSSTANSDGLYQWYSNVIIPPVQNAVEGSFDPKALVATGGATLEDGKFRFRYIVGLAKFSVSDDDVTEVSFSSTRYMAGITQFNQLASQPKGPSGVGNGVTSYGERATSVTVKAAAGETLTKGATYYAVMRYTGSNAYENFRATLSNSQGGTAEKISSANFSVQRKTIYDLGNFSGLVWNNPQPGVSSLYDKFDKGEDIVIAGKTYNKSAYPNYKKIGPRNLGGDNLNGAGDIVFLEAGEYTTAGEAKFTHDIVVIGDNPQDMPVIKSVEKSWNLSGAGFTGAFLTFDLSAYTTNQFFTNKTATGQIPHFIFEDCVIKGCPRYFYATNSSSYGIGIGEIIVNRCTFGTANTNSPALINVNGSMTNPTAFRKFKVTNSVFYHSSGTVTGWILFNFLPNASAALDALTWPMEMSLENNLFYNIATNSSNARNYAVTSLSIKNNLIVCPDYTPANGMKLYTQRMNPVPTYFTAAYDNNAVYAAAGEENNWIIADNAYTTDIGLTKKIPLLGENPLESADLANGVFVVKTAYKSYGPQK